jgi:hypothetical protein
MEIKLLISGVGKDWEEFKKVMKTEYQEEDVQYQMTTMTFLEAFKNKERDGKDLDALKSYCRQYSSLSTNLVKAGKLPLYTRVKWFLEGLPEWYRRKVIMSVKFRFEDEDVPEEAFKDCYDKVMVLLGRAKAMADFGEAGEHTARATELVEAHYKVMQKEQPIYSFEHVPTFSATENHLRNQDVSHPTTAPTIKVADPASPTSLDTRMEEMTRSFQSLVLQMQASLSNAVPNPMSIPPPAQNYRPNASTLTLSDPALSADTRPPLRCWKCNTLGHSATRCMEWQRLVSAGHCHLNAAGDIYLGPEREGATRLQAVRNKSWVQIVKEAVARHQQTLSGGGAPINSRQITVSMPGDPSSEEELEDATISQIEARVAAAMTEKQRGKRPEGRQFTDPVEDAHSQATKRTLRSAVKERNYPIARAPRAGQYEALLSQALEDGGSREDTLKAEPSPLISTIPPPVAITTSEQGQSGGERLPRTQLRKIMKENKAGVEFAVMEKILNTLPQITIGEILQLSPKLQQLFWGTFTDPRAAQAAPNAMVSALGVEVRKLAEKTYARFDRLLYTAASPHLPVVILGERVMALLDSGSEVNVMSLEMCNRLGLPIREMVTLNMHSASGDTERFMGIAEDVPISVGPDVSHQVPIWVIQNLSSGLILGQPYMQQTHLVLTNEEDGLVNCRLQDDEGRTVVTYIVKADAKQNRVRGDMRFDSSVLKAKAGS